MTLDTSQPLTISAAMKLATELHHAGDFESAYKIYERVLEVQPEHPDAIHFMAIMAHQQGQQEDAVRLMTRSIELVPDNAGFHSNLGNLMFACERFEEAEQAYRRAIELDPERPDVLNNYAVLCKGIQRYPDSEQLFLRAIALAPGFSEAHNNLAHLYMRQGRINESVAQACEALICEPGGERAREILGIAYCLLKRFDEAAQVYREWLEEEPGNPRALHYLAACTGQDVPARASDAYVQQVFDIFSESFDAKLARLEYRAPALVGQAVATCLGEGSGGLDVFDVGCGTGLCGPYLKPYAKTLVGVDLSSGMLAKARERGLYDELHQAELTAFLHAHPDASDLVVSADTLVYFGALDEVLRNAAITLRRGGHLCFTVEAIREDQAGDFLLQHNGRYAHAERYLRAALERAGLGVVSIEPEALRYEGGDKVAGWLVLSRKAA